MDLEDISAWLFRETVQKWEDPHRMIFKWSKCDKSGSIAGHLKEHERTHMGEKPFKCTKCYKSFFTSSYLKTHERIHSGEIQVWQGRKVWQVFSTSSSLKDHERTHTGEKPFKCSKCDKSFLKSDLLKDYERTKTGEKPFKCSKCDKSFSKSDPWANPQLREAIHKRVQKHGQFYVVCSRVGWSGQPHLLTQKCNIKT